MHIIVSHLFLLSPSLADVALQFRKCLRQTRIDLDDRHVQIAIDHFDPTTSGQINWGAFVYGVGPTGVERSPPFFLNGGDQYEILKFLRRNWRSIFAKCKAFEVQRSIQLKLPRSSPTGFIPKADLLSILQSISPPRNSQPSFDLSTLAGMIVSSYESAFGKQEDAPAGETKRISINYLGLCKYIAGESFEAEKMCRNKWETIVEILNSAATQSEEPVSRGSCPLSPPLPHSNTFQSVCFILFGHLPSCLSSFCAHVKLIRCFAAVQVGAGNGAAQARAGDFRIYDRLLVARCKG